jgi:hypothetical protein
MKKLSMLILAVAVLAGCYRAPTPPVVRGISTIFTKSYTKEKTVLPRKYKVAIFQGFRDSH